MTNTRFPVRQARQIAAIGNSQCGNVIRAGRWDLNCSHDDCYTTFEFNGDCSPCFGFSYQVQRVDALITFEKTTLPGGFFVSEQESTGSSEDRSTIFDLPLFLIAFNIIVVGGRLGNGQYCTVSLFFEQAKSSQ
uniref:hypothetical protein n=1 Tax=Enterobacter hormaechei TaxID=158836 RepID=UPI00266FF606|nr:hypothetical protein [Enterobacter hormaechei]WJR85998.1 hypothetical protein [Enterobacter hormaechei subsp. steigerwaltii]